MDWRVCPCATWLLAGALAVLSGAGSLDAA
jgi:hypothetical protein